MLVLLNDYLRYIMLLCGLLIGTWLIWRRRERVGQNAVWQALLTGVIFTATSFGAALLFATFENSLAGAPSFGGISTYGVYLFAAPFLLLCAKIFRLSARDYLDLFSIYAIPSLFLMRCDCMIGGCCGGKEIFDTGLRWPTRETELIFFVVIFAVLVQLERKNEIPGQMFPILMISYGCFRFINEWFREGDNIVAGLHMAHMWSLLCVGVGLSIWFELKSLAARKTANGNRHTHRRN